MHMDWVADAVAVLALGVSVIALVYASRRNSKVEWDVTESKVTKQANGDFVWRIEVVNRGGVTAEHVEMYVPAESRRTVAQLLDEQRTRGTDEDMLGETKISALMVTQLRQPSSQPVIVTVMLRWRELPRRKKLRYKAIDLPANKVR
jgi:uncharacterized protein (TIGR02588 family)